MSQPAHVIRVRNSLHLVRLSGRQWDVDPPEDFLKGLRLVDELSRYLGTVLAALALRSVAYFWSPCGFTTLYITPTVDTKIQVEP